jgi:hypothetical protein
MSSIYRDRTQLLSRHCRIELYLDQVAPLRGAGPGVSAAARPQKARAAHAGPHRGTRHIRTAHPPGSTGARSGSLIPDRSQLAAASRHVSTAASWTTPEASRRPSGYDGDQLVHDDVNGEVARRLPIPGGPAIMDPVQAASSRSVTAPAAGTVTGQRGRKDLVDLSSGLTRLAPIREWGHLAWGPLDRRDAGRATYDQPAI